MKRVILCLTVVLLVLVSGSQVFAATCDASYSSKTIFLPDQDMNRGITVNIQNIDFSSMGVALADLNDVRVFDENGGCEELDRICDGTSASVDGNCYFRLNNSFTKGRPGRNSTYFLYYGNASAGEPPDENVARASVCGWETGESCFLTTGDSLGDTNTAISRFGDTSYFMDGSAQRSIVRLDGLGSRGADLNYTTWFYDGSGQSTGVILQLQKTGEQILCNTYVLTGEVRTRDGTSFYAYSAATWYQLHTSYEDGATDCFYTIRDVDGNDLAASPDTPAGTGGTVARVVSTINVGVRQLHFDNRFLSAPVVALGVCPSESCDLNMTLEFRDENTFTQLVGLSVDINGTVYTTDSDGQVGFPIGNVSADENVVVRAWDDDNYGTRYFEFDVNSVDSIDVNLLMLRDLNGFDIDFKFYQPNQSTVLANTKLWVYDEDNNLVSIRTTDAAGLTSFFLEADSNSADGNYYFVTASGTRYDKVRVTFKRPLDEENLDVVSPYDLDIGRLASKSFAGQSADLVFYVLPNTLSYYKLDLNAGTSYYPRKLEVNYRGNPVTATIQMYMPKVVDGLLSVFFTKNINNISEPGILIRVFKAIVGAGTVEVQSVITDGAGTATLSFILDDEYRFDFYDSDNVFLFNKTLRTNFSSYYVYVDTGTIDADSTDATVEFITIGGLPNVGYVAFSDQGYDVNVTIDVNNGTVLNSWFTIVNDDGNVTFNSSCGAGCGYTIEVKDMNNTRDVKVRVFVETASGLKLEKTWSFLPYDSQADNWIATLQSPAFRQEWGCSTNPNEPCFFLLMVSAFMIIGMIATAGAGLTADRSAIGIIAMIGMAIFTYLTWIPVGFFIMACLAVFAGLVLARRVL